MMYVLNFNDLVGVFLNILSNDGNKHIQVFCILFAVLFSANNILRTTLEISVLRCALICYP